MGLFSKTKTRTLPATGYYALPAELRELDQAIYSSFRDPRTFAESNYAPLGLPDYEQFLSPEAIQSTALQFSNPFQQGVIGALNREATGADSISRAAIARAGGLGSNRDFLASSDVEQQRQGAIARLLNQDFERSRNLAIGTGQGRLNQALAERDVAQQGRRARINKLNEMQDFLNRSIAVNRQGEKERTIKTKSGGLGGILGSIGGIAGTALGGPIGGAIGGGLGSVAGGGGLGGALTGAYGGYSGLGGFGGFGGGGLGGGGLGNALGQRIGRFGTGGVYGAVQPIFLR